MSSSNVSNKCENCNKTFSNKYILKSHLKIHQNREKLFKCDECLISFFLKIHLENHFKTVHCNLPKNFVCGKCSKSFKSLNNLQTHESVHEEKCCLCRFCEKTFSRIQDVRLHEKIHLGIKDFKCNECDKSFVQASNLLSHIKTVHKQLKSHKCQLCNKTYKRKRLLDYHSLSAHGETTNAKKLSCEECDFSTIYPSHLKKHKQKHFEK